MNRYRRPGYRITLNGDDITPRINGRLTQLTLRESRGLEADQLDMTLADHDGELALPPGGAELHLAFGWVEDGLVEKGRYTVDEITHSGTPDQLTLRARSADMRQTLPGKRTQSWHNTTAGEIVTTIAQRHQLTPVLGRHLAAVRVNHLDQTEESDLNFLTRLGERLDAVAAVKAGRLLFTAAGVGRTASGSAMPAVTLTRKDGDQHRYRMTERDTYTGVKAFWNDESDAKRQEVIAGRDDNAKQLRPTYATEQDALDAAQSEWQRLQRGVAEFELALAEGNPRLTPETPLRLRGYKPEIDATPWLITEVEHRLGSAGLETQVRCEVEER